MAEDSYFVPAASGKIREVEKKSEFIAHLQKTSTEEEALAFLEQIRSEHRTAAHNVYAYVLRENKRARYSDDGEPAKTAGLPVLSAIQHAELYDCTIVVTRYFGGVKLGTGGLVRAYGSAASQVIQSVGKALIQSIVALEIVLPYAHYDSAARLIEQAGAKPLQEPQFMEDVRLQVTLPQAQGQPLALQLQELMRGQPCVTISKPYFDSW